MIVAAEWGSGQVFWSLFWFALFVMWIALLIKIFADVIRADDMEGWMKALWLFFLIVVPILSVVVYLLTRGGLKGQHPGMHPGMAPPDMIRTH